MLLRFLPLVLLLGTVNTVSAGIITYQVSGTTTDVAFSGIFSLDTTGFLVNGATNIIVPADTVLGIPALAFTVNSFVFSDGSRVEFLDTVNNYVLDLSFSSPNVLGTAAPKLLGGGITPSGGGSGPKVTRATLTPTPEPASIALTLVGAAALLGGRLRKRR